MSYVHYIKGTDIKVRTSKTHIYTQAVRTSYHGKIQYTCHENIAKANSRIHNEISEYNRHPFDFNDDYNPNEEGYFEVLALEVR